MAIPLYQDTEIPNAFPQNGHLGLWFTRFFNQYDEEWQVKKEKPKQEDGKRKWIKLTADKVCGHQKALDHYRNRVLNLIKALKRKDKLDTNDYAICETNWHFVTGMGLPHPVENGMAWHHTLGVPFLAGSTIKGLLRAWVEGGWNEELNPEKTVERRQNWFGMVKGEDGDTEDKAGQLIFFDAVPIEQVQLTPDIMTPHYGDWYAEGDKITGVAEHERIPADWHDPIPIPFLAVKKAKFLVTVVARDKSNDKEARLALKELVQALQWLGAGAKTAAGYGHLVRNTGEETTQLEKKREEETAQKLADEKEIRRSKLTSDLEKEIDQDLFEVGQNEAEKKANDWLTKMEAAKPEDAKKIAYQLKAFYESIDKWEKPSKKKQKPKVDRVKKILNGKL
ncbi:type III-B CRISPR module RAMP protein Cmr6 [Candidatus Parabeggiatoa sp. HSG14]|uniref:type III-B CRISPR module RAMP protein Cmr6 n=1 Tax=Candidatus Parabeggiatoa sp. HSG14 TaxID=3055593 RepID=UPI0025A71098|nr:type III-B CRISPR module RAMP protein Cmr6 [Thiotrichales bacterium HSG14]